MEKFFVGLILGLGVGGAGGYVLFQPDDGPSTATGIAKGKTPSSSQSPTASPSREPMDAIPRGEHQRALDEQKRRLEAETLMARNQTIARDQEVERLRERVATLEESARQAAPDAAPAAQPSLTPEEIKTRGDALLASITDAVKTLNKDDAIKGLAELRELGPGAYPQYFAAYDFFITKGNPWSAGAPGITNELKLNQTEYASLMEPAQAVFALTDNSGIVSDGGVISASYQIAWGDNTRSSEEKTALFGAALRNTRSVRVADTLLRNMESVRHPSALPFLRDTATNSALDAEVRQAAIRVLATFQDDPTVPATLRALAADPMASVARAANTALVLLNPPVAGFFITDVLENQQAALAGVKVGDIMTRYNGAEVTDIPSLNAAKATVTPGQSAVVELYRDGVTVAVTLAPGQIGINGVAVKKK